MRRFFRTPEGIRTHDLKLRRLALYPTELRARRKCESGKVRKSEHNIGISKSTCNGKRKIACQVCIRIGIAS